MEPNPSVANGIESLRLGHTAEALEHFKQAVFENPQDPQGWLGIASVVDDPERKRFCLKKVLEIDPANPHALQGLEELDSPPQPAPAREETLPLPLPVETEQPPAPGPAQNDENFPEQEQESARDDIRPENAMSEPGQEPGWKTSQPQDDSSQSEPEPAWQNLRPQIATSEPEPESSWQNSQPESYSQEPAPAPGNEKSRPAQEQHPDPALDPDSFLAQLADVPPEKLPPLVDMPPRDYPDFPPRHSSKKLKQTLAAIEKQRRSMRRVNLLITLIILMSMLTCIVFAYLRL
jgi:hypothetical protein